MNKRTKFLDSLHVPKPCPANWENMTGDSHVRLCRQCHKSVYNISDMTRKQAEAFVANSDGKQCAIFYRYANGAVAVRNEAAALSKMKRRASRTVCAAFTAVLGFCTATIAETPIYRKAPSFIGLHLGAKNAEAQTQSERAVILGTVSDPNKAVIPQATVTITNESTNKEQTTATDEEGNYQIPSLESGSYTLKVSSSLFQTFIEEHIPLHMNRKVRVDAMLNVAVVGEFITLKYKSKSSRVVNVLTFPFRKLGEAIDSILH